MSLSYLEQRCPLSTEERTLSARKYLSEVHSMSELNAAVFSRAAPEQQRPPPEKVVQEKIVVRETDPLFEQRVREAVAACDGAVHELKREVASLEANRTGLERRTAAAESATGRVASELRSRLAAVESRRPDEDRFVEVVNRLAAAEARAEAAERVAAEALKAAVRDTPLNDIVYRTEARVAALENVQTRPVARDNGYSHRLDRAEAASDNLAAGYQGHGERIARLEEQVLETRSRVDAAAADADGKHADLAAAAVVDRDCLSRLDQRATSAASVAEDKIAEIMTRVEAIAVDVGFLREHQAALETQLTSVQRRLDDAAADGGGLPPAYDEDDDDGDVSSPAPPPAPLLDDDVLDQTIHSS